MFSRCSKYPTYTRTASAKITQLCFFFSSSSRELKENQMHADFYAYLLLSFHPMGERCELQSPSTRIFKAYLALFCSFQTVVVIRT